MQVCRARQKSGFTLVELIAVILIVCILAIFAIPRTVDLQSGAYRASVEGTAGAFSTAVLMANLICQMKNGAGANDLQGYGDGDVDFNANCLPIATRTANGNGNNGNGNNGNGNGNNGNGNGNGNGNNGNGNGNNGNGNGNSNNGNGNGNGGSSASTSEGCATLWNQLLSSSQSVSAAADTDYGASAAGNTCTYTLRRDPTAARSFSYDSETGTVTVLSNP
jgi:prepilin-type N-terminal cleavage/methylation domain-containing protein